MIKNINKWIQFSFLAVAFFGLIISYYSLQKTIDITIKQLDLTMKLQKELLDSTRKLHNEQLNAQRELSINEKKNAQNIHNEELEEIRKHARASVKPLLKLIYGPSRGLVLSNIGMGPAIIKGIKVYSDNKLITLNSKEKSKKGRMFQELYKELLLIKSLRHNDRIESLYVDVLDYKKSLKIEIKYSSIYEVEIFKCNFQ